MGKPIGGRKSGYEVRRRAGEETKEQGRKGERKGEQVQMKCENMKEEGKVCGSLQREEEGEQHVGHELQLHMKE